MKNLLAVFVITSALHAQGNSLVLTSSASVVRPSGTPAERALTLTVGYAGPGPLAAISWIFILPAGVTATPAAGAQAIAAGKAQTCNGPSPCVVVGMNANVISPGEVGKYTLTFPANFAPGQISFSLSNPKAASPTGAAVPMTISVPLLIAVLPNRYDLNADGKVDAADQKLAIDQEIGVTACTTGDVNGDGACDVADAQLVGINPL